MLLQCQKVSEEFPSPPCGAAERRYRRMETVRPRLAFSISQAMASPNKCLKSNKLADRVPNAGLLYRRRFFGCTHGWNVLTSTSTYPLVPLKISQSRRRERRRNGCVTRVLTQQVSAVCAALGGTVSFWFVFHKQRK